MHSLPIMAYDFMVDGLCYNILSTSELTCEVTKEDLFDLGTESGTFNIPSRVTYRNYNFTVVSIGDIAFSNWYRITEFIIPNTVVTIGERAFYYCTYTETITIPNSVTTISDKAFILCKNLDNVVIPESVTSFGNNVFEDCSSLKNVTFLNSITKLPKGTFKGCSSLTSYDIPSSVASIEDNAFEGCTNLKRITIPSNVTLIGQNVFDECTNLENVISLSVVPPSISDNTFPSSVILWTTLYVPQGSLKAYKESSTWSQFSNIKEIDPTDIEIVKSEEHCSQTIYDINGRLIKQKQKGINIINGKKILVN